MGDRTFSPPPPLAVTVAGHTMAVRFVDVVTVDGQARHGWADVDRGELLVSLAIDGSLMHLPSLIGGAIVEALWQLCPEYGVHPANVMAGLDADVWVEGEPYCRWLKTGIVGSLVDLSDATYPTVYQRPDGTWACPLCGATFEYLPHGPPDWHPLARDHVAECHGVDLPRVRSIRYRPERSDPAAP